MKKVNLGFILIIACLIIFSYFYVVIYSKYDVMLYLSDYKRIIQLNHIIEVLLAIIIGFFIYKVFFRSTYVFGAVIMRKLFLLLASMIIIPSLINIKIANYFIDKTVNRLFNPQIEELFDNSFNIAEESIKYFSQELRKKSIIAIEYLKLVNKNKTELNKIISILDVNALTIYNITGSLAIQSNLNNQEYFINILPEYILNKIRTTGYYYEINKNKKGKYLFYYYQLYDSNKIIALTQFAPEFITIDNSKIMQNKNLYLGLLNNKDNLKNVYTSTLIISVLLAISIAVLLSIFFSKFLIKRIANLIENIELLKQGSYRNNNAFQGDDELSQLITAFNEMGHDLDRIRKLEKFQREQITAYKNYLENLINNLSLSVIVYDRNFRVKNINIVTKEILEVDLENINGIPINLWGRIYPHLQRFSTAIESNFLKNNSSWEENIIVRSKHNIRNLFVKTVVFNTYEDIQYITLINDVTNLIKAKQNQAWADIAKRLAHEIKNPLTPIVLSAERIERKLTPKLEQDDQTFLQRLVKQIITQVDDLKELVNKFRDFANINKPNLAKIEFIHFFKQFLVLYENVKYLQFRSELETDDVFIMGDTSLLRQVFHNLIKNALEGVENIQDKNIEIILTKKNERLCILIKDNGCGFAPVILENLFEPYQTTKGAKGSGLGMAIVKKIIDEHNGKIEVFNDNGAHVVVKLPLAT